MHSFSSGGTVERGGEPAGLGVRLSRIEKDRLKDSKSYNSSNLSER